MSNRDYTIILLLAAAMFLVGYNVLEKITNQPLSTNSFGMIMIIVFALYVIYLEKQRKKPKK